MATTIQTKSSEIRCFECGSTDTHYICHHCGRSMHSADSVIPPNQGFLTTKMEFAQLAENVNFKPKSDVFIGYGYLSRGFETPPPPSDDPYPKTAPVHCRYCKHYTLDLEPLKLGFYYIFVMSPLAVLAGLLNGLIGGAVFFSSVLALFLLSYWQYRQKQSQTMVPLPIYPGVERLTVQDTIKVELELNRNEDERYTSKITDQQGRVQSQLYFTSHDQKRVGKYQTRFDISDEQRESINFRAGYLALRGKVKGIRGTTGNGFVRGRQHLIEFRGQLKQHPYLKNPDNTENQWEHVQEYEIPFQNEESKNDYLPFFLVPTIIQENRTEDDGAQVRESYLELYLSSNIDKLKAPALEQMVFVPELQVSVPVAFGDPDVRPAEVVGSMPAAQIEPNSVRTTLTWKNVPVGHTKRFRFYIHFDEALPEDNLVLKGHLHVNFKGTVSGIDGADYFSPLGHRAEAQNFKATTSYKVEFKFDLSKILQREMICLPTELAYENLAPTNNVVIELARALSSTKLFVSRVMENPSYNNPRESEITNHSWDIVGREYQPKTMHPIDYAIALKGVAFHEHSRKGETQIDISVQSKVNDPDVMHPVVKKLAQRVETLVREVCEGQGGKPLAM